MTLKNSKILDDRFKDWYIITDPDEIDEVYRLLHEYRLAELEDSKDVFMKFGYHVLSPGEKETYYFLKDLVLLREKSNKKNMYLKKDECSVSLDYMSIVLNTHYSVQSKRIKALTYANLITPVRTKFNANTYRVVMKPKPDSTFLKTIDKIYKRKRTLELIDFYKKLMDTPEDVDDTVKSLGEFYEDPYCKKLINTKLPDFTPFK